jgi:hypothetical protein
MFARSATSIETLLGNACRIKYHAEVSAFLNSKKVTGLSK